MPNNILLISVKPKYAKKIFNGSKTVELRRVSPKIKKDDLVLVYVSSPKKALMGGFQVEKIIKGDPQILWFKIKTKAGISKKEFDIYYKNTNKGVAIIIKKVWSFNESLDLDHIKKYLPYFNPPQGYRYIKKKEKFTDIYYKLKKYLEIDKYLLFE